MSSSATLTLRPAHPSDAAGLATLSRLHVEYGLRWRWTPRRIRQAIRDTETIVLVASRNGEQVGFAIMRFGEWTAHLLLLAVDPSCRRAGIGRALLDWLDATCRTAGIREVRLEVREANSPARDFYASLGYIVVDRIERYYDGREAALVFVRQLV